MNAAACPGTEPSGAGAPADSPVVDPDAESVSYPPDADRAYPYPMAEGQADLPEADRVGYSNVVDPVIHPPRFWNHQHPNG